MNFFPPHPHHAHNETSFVDLPVPAVAALFAGTIAIVILGFYCICRKIMLNPATYAHGATQPIDQGLAP